ncbi:MAG: EthD domain-containing protein [Sphingobium sp.]
MNPDFDRLRRREALYMGAGAAIAGLTGLAGSAVNATTSSNGQSMPAELNKSISFLRRKPGTTREQFNAKWLSEHGPGARDIPGIEGFVVGEVVDDPAAGASRAVAAPSLDGITESWQAPGIDRAAQARQYPHVREWLGAAPTYIGAIKIVVTREHVMVPPIRGGNKVMTLIYRKPEQTHDQFVEYMLKVHGPLSREVPGLRGYVLSEIIRSPAMQGLPGIPELGEPDMIGQSWMSPDPADHTPDSPERKAWLADGAANFGSFFRYLMKEHEFVTPPYGRKTKGGAA